MSDAGSADPHCDRESSLRRALYTNDAPTMSVLMAADSDRNPYQKRQDCVEVVWASPYLDTASTTDELGPL